MACLRESLGTIAAGIVPIGAAIGKDIPQTVRVGISRPSKALVDIPALRVYKVESLG